jgi:ribonuclease J
LAREVGIPEDRILICEDGDTVEVGSTLRRGERITAGMTFVDGIGIGDVGQVVLRDRRKLAGDGIVVVVVTVDSHSGEVLAGPDIIDRGVVEEPAEAILEEARHRVLMSLKESATEVTIDPRMLGDHIRTALRRFFMETTKRKPVIVPVVMEV